MDKYDYVIAKPEIEEVLYHAGFHKYIDKYLGKNGKWIYKYTKRINNKLKEANRQFLNNVGYPIELETKHQVNKLGKKVNNTIKKVKDKNLYQRAKRKVGEKTGKYKRDYSQTSPFSSVRKSALSNDSRYDTPYSRSGNLRSRGYVDNRFKENYAQELAKTRKTRSFVTSKRNSSAAKRARKNRRAK